MTAEFENSTRDVEKKAKQDIKLWIKMVLIAIITLLLLIPQALITNLIDERQQTRQDAQEEIATSWGGEQRVAGPAIVIPDTNGEKQAFVLPSQLKITGKVSTQTLRRGIFDINVFNAPLTLTGEFSIPAEKIGDKLRHGDLSGAYLFIGIEDLRGLTDNVSVNWNGQSKQLESCSTIGSGLSCPIDARFLTEGGKIRFTIKVPLKGSDGINFCPLGSTTTVSLTSDWGSPSFNGHYLPTQRNVGESGFSATWKVLDVNRDFGQIINASSNWFDIVAESQFGVVFHTQADQYQQTTRTVKYAFLIIVLTFAVVLIVDIRKRTNIHPVQYLLIGIALMLFYTLLLSFSEHITFALSYGIAAIMTIGLITAFMAALLKGNRKTALIFGLMLSVLYLFLYILLQLETLALLVGSIGLFIILAVAMFVTVKLRNGR